MIRVEHIQELLKRRAILVLGEGLSQRSARRASLAIQLASKLNLPPHLPFFHVAQLFEERFGRAALISAIRTSVGLLEPPSKNHHLLTSFPASLVISTSYDDTVWQAYSQHTIPTKRYYTRAGLADLDENSHTNIVCLLGSLSDPSSLLLTDDDFEELFYTLPRLSRVLSSYLATRVILYMGFDPDDPILVRLNQTITRYVDRHDRASYFVYSQESELAIGRLTRMGLSVVKAEENSFLEAIQQKNTQQGMPVPDGSNLERPEAPYKFLDYFTAADSSIFFGRDLDTSFLTQLILAHKLVVLFGPSGVGKTSLLQAGILPTLISEGYDAIDLRSYDDPIARVRRLIQSRYSDGPLPPWAYNVDLKTCVETIVPPEVRIVFILDQFEQFFINVGRFERLEFSEQVAECRSGVVDVRFILCMRSEYFHHLDELSTFLPEIYDHRFRLGRLDEVRAEQAIVQPAALFGLTYERELLDTLLGELAQGDFDPPQLQIVCFTLLNDLSKGGNVFRLDQYNALGGMRGILSGYLDKAIESVSAALGTEQQALVRGVLSSMVSTDRTKALMSLEAIVHEPAVMRLSRDRGLIENTLDQLIQHRIVRMVSDETNSAYELAHDYLVPRIWEWLDSQGTMLKHLRAMLRQELSNSRQLDLLMDEEKMRVIDLHKDDLYLNNEELELVFKSALKHKLSVPYWLSRAREQDISVIRILEEGSSSPDHNIRHMSIASAGSLIDATLIPLFVQALSDSYPQVRVAAIRSLEQIGEPASVSALLKGLVHERYVPRGSFIMGSSEGESVEQPEHEVILDGYYIDKYPITNEDYERFLKDHPNHSPPTHWPNGEVSTGMERHPIIFVSWIDAVAYATWAGKRLPTEAEWERAATWDHTKNKKLKFPWGDNADPSKCNTAEARTTGTTPVDLFGESAFSPCGCGDLAGNVWEWTGDWFSKKYDSSIRKNPQGPQDGDYKAVRGGSWNYSIDFARGTSRAMYAYPLDMRLANVGFRLALSAQLTSSS